MEMLLSYFYLHIRHVIYKSSVLQHFHTISKFKYIISKHMFSPWLIFTFVSSQKILCYVKIV